MIEDLMPEHWPKMIVDFYMDKGFIKAITFRIKEAIYCTDGDAK